MIIRIESGSDLKERFDYLLNRDPSVVSVLHRDLSERAMLQLADSIPRKNKFFSIVVSFAPEDRGKVEKNRQEILSDLLGELLKGYKIKPATHVVEHRDDNCLHWHITILNDSGGKDTRFFWWKRDMSWLNAVQDYIRTKYNLAVPMHRQSSLRVNLSRRYKHLLEKIPELRNREHLRRKLHQLAESLYRDREATNREELIERFRELGFEITRKGRNYITVKIGDIRVRLKGAIYDESFGTNRTSSEKKSSANQGDRRDPQQLRNQIDEAGRARFNEIRKLNLSLDNHFSSHRDSGGSSLRLEDVGKILSQLRKLPGSRSHRRKSLSSARTLKEERWRQLSVLATSEAHQDLLEKTNKILGELLEELNKHQKVQIPKFVFDFVKEDSHGMSI